MDRRLAGKGMRPVAGATMAANAVLLAVLLMAGCKSAPAPASAAVATPAQSAVPEAPATTAQPQPIPHAHIYPEVSAAKPDIQAALKKARREHKRVLLDFGGDWCPDCQVLNIYFHQSPNAELLEKNFVLVDVNIGHEDANLDVAKRYGVPMPHGVPALVVVGTDGKVVYAQNKEFSDMRHMEPQSVTDFLNKWKAR